MTRTPTYEDAKLLLKLYDLRREPRMREARAWFVSNFRFKTVDEFMKACPPGSDQNASARQTTSYWDMVASFITSGILNQDLFFESNRELLLTYIRLRPILAEWRTVTKDPQMFSNLEMVALAYMEWMNRRGPEVLSAFESRVK